ncbi:MAG: DUF177 domain-containing protein [Myxococcales bacterium]|jgi:uncharacterized protein|nr:DUF177 domain-containing protein [Myxococcales bacterium]
MPAFVLDIKDLDAIGREFAFVVEPSWLAAELEGTDLRAHPERSKGTLEVRVQRSNDDVLVQAHVVTGLVADCDRCLEEVFLPIDVRVTTLLSPEGSGPIDVEFAEDALDRDTYRGDEVILDEIVREHIVLEVPMQIHCPGGCEMPSIPASVRGPDDFGAKPEVDPRFASLLKLKDDSKKDQE